MPRILRVALALPALFLLGFAFLQLARMTRADYWADKDDPASLDKAAQLTPDNFAVHIRLATLDPTRDDEIKRARDLNPREPAVWILQSVHQEETGDLAGAEQSLKRAVKVSRYFAPRWSLTAFYYRQQRVPEFLASARETLASGTGDYHSIFQMARNLGISASVVREQILPHSAEVAQAFLDFTVSTDDLDAMAPAAESLVAMGTKASVEQVIAASKALFLAGRSAEAVTIWNAAIRAQWIDMNPLTPPLGQVISDPTFVKPRLQLGFDWRLIAPRTVAVTGMDSAGERLDFSGNQPEQCDLLAQYVPLLSHQSYILKTRYRTHSLPDDTGLSWTIRRLVRQNHVDTLLPSFAGQDSQQTAPFSVPALPDGANGAYELVLSYARAPGTTRVNGQLMIDSVEFQLANAKVSP